MSYVLWRNLRFVIHMQGVGDEWRHIQAGDGHEEYILLVLESLAYVAEMRGGF